MANYVIHFDGSCFPNPGGPAAYGFTIDKDGIEIAAKPGLVPPSDVQTSNNVAEFYALYAAFTDHKLKVETGDTVSVYGDSQLVINIMNRKWKANSDKLYWEAYRRTALELNRLEGLDVEVNFGWIPREENQRCDDLSKEINNAPK